LDFVLDGKKNDLLTSENRLPQNGKSISAERFFVLRQTIFRSQEIDFDVVCR